MIWLVGDQGMLGTELGAAFEAAGLPFVGSDRDVSILDSAALDAFARGKGITWIVNCAAYTAVDRAEDEPEACERLNAEGPANVARAAAKIGARLVHLSTDYVFDGLGARPYREDDPVNPLGVYGRTKAEGERRVRAVLPEAFIIRTAWLYGRRGGNFVRTMLRLMRERERIGVVADQVGSPTNAADLAAAIVAIISGDSRAYGSYHFASEGETSWQGFALEIYHLARSRGLLDRDCAVDSLTTEQYPTKATRPRYSASEHGEDKKIAGHRGAGMERGPRAVFRIEDGGKVESMKAPDPEMVKKAWAACSWGNTTETAEDWLSALQSHDEARKRRIFGKLFVESPDGMLIHELFDESAIRSYIKNYERPFPRAYSERRRKVWRYLYCGIREPIPELDWVIGK